MDIKELKNEIINIIKNNKNSNTNDITKLETYIVNNYIKLDVINDGNFNILIYAIENDASFNIIKFILKYGNYENLNNTFTHDNGMKIPLFITVSKNNFELSDFFIDNYEADVNYNNGEIIDYLKNNNTLNRKTFKYLLMHGIKNEKINSLIVNDSSIFNNDILKDIYNHFIFDNDFILMLLERFYKNKTGISKEKLEDIIYKEKSKIIINDQLYQQAYQSKSYDLIKLLYYCDFDNDNIIFRRCFKYNLVECSLKTKDTNFIQSVFSIVGINFENIFTEKNILLAIQDNSLKTPKFLIKAALNTLPSPSKKELENTLISKKKKYNLMECILNIKNINYIQSVFSTVEINCENVPSKKKNLLAIQNTSLKTPKFLIKAALNTFSTTPKNENYLNYIINTLIKVKCLPLIKYIVEEEYKNEINLNAMDIYGEYPLITAAYSDDIDIFGYLLDEEIDGNIKNSHGHSLIFIAIENNISFVEYLLLKNPTININVEDNNKMTPLDYAINENNVNLLNILLDYSIHYSIKINFYKKDINGNHPLLKAIIQEKKEIISILINYGIKNKIDININGKNNNNDYPLSKAIYKKDDATVSLILQYGQKNKIDLIINEKTKDGKLPLIKAIDTQNNIIINSYIVNLLLEYGIKNNGNLNINEKDSNGSYPLFIAIKQKNTKLVSLILKYGEKRNIKLNINEKDQFGNYPLLYAIKNGYLDIVMLLIYFIIEQGYNMKKLFKNTNPLIYAYYKNQKEIFDFLKNYINLFGETDSKGYSLLYYAISKNDIPTVQYLINNGSDINFKTENGTSLIHMPFKYFYFNEDLFNILLQNKNIDLNRKNSNGDTVLILLIKNPYITPIIKEMYIKTIIKRGVNINIKDNYGISPLIHAIEINSFAIIKYLVENGANVNEVTENEGKSPLIIACEYNSSIALSNTDKSNFLRDNSKIVSLLVNHGANINHQDKYGNIPLTYALMNAKLYIINYLIHCGTNLLHKNKKNESLYTILEPLKHLFKNKKRYREILNILNTAQN